MLLTLSRKEWVERNEWITPKTWQMPSIPIMIILLEKRLVKKEFCQPIIIREAVIIIQTQLKFTRIPLPIKTMPSGPILVII